MWNVLIAEGDVPFCQQLVEGLGKVARCTMVHSGEDALLAYLKGVRTSDPFDFILSEVIFPKMDGFEVLETVRLLEERAFDYMNHETIFILLTSYNKSLLSKIHLGWDDFLSKPIDIDILQRHMSDLAKDRWVKPRQINIPEVVISVSKMKSLG